MFTNIGPIYSCRIMRDKRTGYSFGYGFVNYVKTQDAHKAITVGIVVVVVVMAMELDNDHEFIFKKSK